MQTTLPLLGGLQTTSPTATDGGPRQVPIGPDGVQKGRGWVGKGQQGAHRVGGGILTHGLDKIPRFLCSEHHFTFDFADKKGPYMV